jgi:hypothetical protein
LYEQVPKIEAKVPKTPEEAEAPPRPKVEPLKFDTPARRKSKVFETAEMFSRSPTLEKPATPLPKKVIIPGVKVSKKHSWSRQIFNFYNRDLKSAKFYLLSLCIQ